MLLLFISRHRRELVTLLAVADDVAGFVRNVPNRALVDPSRVHDLIFFAPLTVRQIRHDTARVFFFGHSDH